MDCACVCFVYSYVAPFGWVWFSAFNPVLIADRISRSKHKICVLLKLLSKISVWLE